MNFIIVIFYFCEVIALFIVLNCIVLIAISFVLDNTPVKTIWPNLMSPVQLKLFHLQELLTLQILNNIYPEIEDKKKKYALRGFKKILFIINKEQFDNAQSVSLIMKSLMMICEMLKQTDDKFDLIIALSFPNMNLDELDEFINNEFKQNQNLIPFLTKKSASFIHAL